jgi:tripartite-type tricarboxylate transporter receptor subunit TctC
MTNRRVVPSALLLAFAAVPVAPATLAQNTYPTRPVRIIVGFPAGTTTDILARIYADSMARQLKGTFVIENVPGAASNTAAATAARADADGHTLYVATNANSTSVSLYKNLRYEFPGDFEPIALLAGAPPVLAVSAKLDVNSVKELIALAKAKPGEVMYGSAGVGTGPYMAAELLNMMAGIKMTHVPYKGTNEAVADLITGRLSVLFAPLPSIAGVAKEGKIKLLAATPERRTSVAPDLPTVAEAGVAGFDVTLWFGLLAPKGTPREILKSLADAVTEAAKTEEVRKRLAMAGGEPLSATLDDFKAFIAADIPKWAKVIQHAGVQPQ